MARISEPSDFLVIMLWDGSKVRTTGLGLGVAVGVRSKVARVVLVEEVKPVGLVLMQAMSRVEPEIVRMGQDQSPLARREELIWMLERVMLVEVWERRVVMAEMGMPLELKAMMI